MMKHIGMVVLALTACGKKDDCQKLFDVMANAVKDSKVSAAKDKFLEQCRKDPKYLEDPTAKCILAASSDSAAADCLKAGFEDYRGKSKASEASLQLNKIGKRAKMAYAESAAFPKGKAKMLPDVPTCCGGDGGKCKPSTEWGNDPVWKALEFSVDEPSLYRYSYESADGKTFEALAVGDADCDGQFATYKLEGTITPDGNASVNLIQPPNGQY